MRSGILVAPDGTRRESLLAPPSVARTNATRLSTDTPAPSRPYEKPRTTTREHKTCNLDHATCEPWRCHRPVPCLYHVRPPAARRNRPQRPPSPTDRNQMERAPAHGDPQQTPRLTLPVPQIPTVLPPSANADTTRPCRPGGRTPRGPRAHPSAVIRPQP